ncbi:MAG: SDR family NAD(P)-dependent oxidoreductase, partial [Actinomycetota bacterium]
MEALEGRVAVVTGGASGIGAALARRFATRGMHVVVADIEEAAIAPVVGELADLGAAGALGVVTDVTDAEAVQSLADRTVEEFGAAHVVCNNAGVAGSPETLSDDLHLPSWRWVIEVNLMGVIHGHAAFLPILKSQDEGHIVNTASMAGHFPGHSAYSASKWGVVAITEGLFHQLGAGGSKVGASCLCPGWVNTQILDSHRNRPEWAAPAPLEEPRAEADLARAYVADQLAGGADPDRVAGLVEEWHLDARRGVVTHCGLVAAQDG